MSSHTHTMPNNLGIAKISAMAHLIVIPDMYYSMDIHSMPGITQVDGAEQMNRVDTTWGEVI